MVWLKSNPYFENEQNIPNLDLIYWLVYWLERFSLDSRKTKTKVSTLANKRA